MTDLNQTLIDAALRAVTRDGQRRELRDGKSTGLELIVGRRGGVWYWRAVRGGRTHRLRLGTLEAWSLPEARTLAAEAHRRLVDHAVLVDERWLRNQRILLGKASPEDLGAEPAAPLSRATWTFAVARDEYLAEVARTLRERTHADYKGKLAVPELAPLEGIPVHQISVDRLTLIARAVGARGAYAMAEGMVRVLRAMWTWMSMPGQREHSRVAERAMALLRAPRRPVAGKGRAAPGTKPRRGSYVPPPLEIGRILAIARSGALPPSQAGAIELLVYTGQRRRAVAEAEVMHLEARIGPGRTNDPLEGFWRIPPSARKVAAKGGAEPRDKVVPLPPLAWQAARRAVEAANRVGARPLFPGRHYGEDGPEAIHPDTITHAFLDMPGVTASPHDVRRALGTHGENVLGFPRALTRVLLDHAEAAGDGVTGTVYALHDRTHVTWPVLDRWVEWCDEQCRLAIEADPRLRDVEWLRAEIAAAKARRKAAKAALPEAAE